MRRIFVWFPVNITESLYYPKETEFKVSHSPNKKNKIEFFRVEDFPRPTLRIDYDENSIVINNLPKKIDVIWKNDKEAEVTLTREGNKSLIKEIEFK